MTNVQIAYPSKHPFHWFYTKKERKYSLLFFLLYKRSRRERNRPINCSLPNGGCPYETRSLVFCPKIFPQSLPKKEKKNKIGIRQLLWLRSCTLTWSSWIHSLSCRIRHPFHHSCAWSFFDFEGVNKCVRVCMCEEKLDTPLEIIFFLPPSLPSFLP